MANIVITSGATKVSINYNLLAAKNKTTVRVVNRNGMVSCLVPSSNACVETELSNGDSFVLDYNDVDTIGGVAPTDNLDLANKLSDLML